MIFFAIHKTLIQKIAIQVINILLSALIVCAQVIISVSFNIELPA
jgi:hypothetical protein